jgi:guanine deaminase
MTTLVRAPLAHTPRAGALEAFDDGGLAFADGRIRAVGEYARVRAEHPEAETIDARDAILLPGLVDTHVHFPQLPVIGAMGLELLDWLKRRTLPEEARMADAEHARAAAGTFVRALSRNGTTTALVFGSHFPVAQEALFAAAERAGLRIASGLVVSDRSLRRELEVAPERAEADGRALIERWHGRGRLRYAIEPRFSVSCSDAMLAACSRLLDAAPGLLFTTHLSCSRAPATTWRPTSATTSCATVPCSPTTSTPPTTSCAASPRAARASPTARRRTPSSAAARSRSGATGSTACASRWAATSAPARG